jgi:hypothetical protein
MLEALQTSFSKLQDNFTNLVIGRPISGLMLVLWLAFFFHMAQVIYCIRVHREDIQFNIATHNNLKNLHSHIVYACMFAFIILMFTLALILQEVTAWKSF